MNISSYLKNDLYAKPKKELSWYECAFSHNRDNIDNDENHKTIKNHFFVEILFLGIFFFLLAFNDYTFWHNSSWKKHFIHNFYGFVNEIIIQIYQKNCVSCWPRLFKMSNRLIWRSECNSNIQERRKSGMIYLKMQKTKLIKSDKRCLRLGQ